ncbi:Uncharacterised protein [Burkholderia pseudomallei]|nr:hypothetical protein DP46_4003 [Burkholderia pseudomallei]CAJ9767219.1 Uncharacterised protein [Burkholderia pseudomallei]VBP73609.1 Uncharacterised protein [Burkholderia pseudomallei]
MNRRRRATQPRGDRCSCRVADGLAADFGGSIRASSRSGIGRTISGRRFAVAPGDRHIARAFACGIGRRAADAVGSRHDRRTARVIGALARAVRPNVGDGAALLRGVDSGARKCRRVARARPEDARGASGIKIGGRGRAEPLRRVLTGLGAPRRASADAAHGGRASSQRNRRCARRDRGSPCRARRDGAYCAASCLRIASTNAGSVSPSVFVCATMRPSASSSTIVLE